MKMNCFAFFAGLVLSTALITSSHAADNYDYSELFNFAQYWHQPVNETNFPFNQAGGSLIDAKDLLILLEPDYFQQPEKTFFFLDQHSGTLPLTMVKINAGRFTMGAEGNDWNRDYEAPPHEVEFNYEFYMSKYEITWAQWWALMGEYPSSNITPGPITDPDSNHPVFRVSWNDCQEFIAELNKLGYGNFRLPSEAEWEYACRASSTTRWHFGDDENQLADYAWYRDNSDLITHPVGSKLPNAFGLYDMYGNLREWCEDDWHRSYNYINRPDNGDAWVDDPRSNLRARRGGSWAKSSGSIHSTYRFNDNSGIRSIDLGFRLVMDAKGRYTPTPTNTPTITATPTNTPIPGSEKYIINLPGLPTGAKPLALARIPRSSYNMGSDDPNWSSDSEKPPHAVNLKHDFFIGRYEITQAQWLAVMGSWPDNAPSQGVGDDYPAYYLSWNDAKSFVDKLNTLGKGQFRMPTEAEWEYACRAGSTTRWSFGDSEDLLTAYAWYAANTVQSQPVGSLLPNAWNMFDMHGNVFEWCADDWHNNYSLPDRPDDGSAWINEPRNANRVLRGGGWDTDAIHSRSSARIDAGTAYRDNAVGFRVGWNPTSFELRSPNEEYYGNFGNSVSGVPDVDGDNHGDVVVGACYESPGSSTDGAGIAYIISGFDGAVIHTLYSPNEKRNGRFGVAVAGLSDVDGDGLGDVIIGAKNEYPDSSPIDAGRAYIFSGSSGELLYTLVSPNEELYGAFGSAVSGVPDLDGDGINDVAVTALTEDHNSTFYQKSGRTYIFSGSSGVLLHTLEHHDEEIVASFGWSVSGIPDVDSDGRGDVIVGAMRDPYSRTWEGHAFIYSGSSGTLLHTLTALNNWGVYQFGGSVSGIEDVNGDGHGDVVVGAALDDSNHDYEYSGNAYIFSGADSVLLHVVKSPNKDNYAYLGCYVSGMADVNGDSRGDFVLGVPSEDPDDSTYNAGRAYIFSGSDGALIRTLDSPNEEEGGRFGSAVSNVPDIDGDGREDVVVGASFEDPADSTSEAGRAYIFLSSNPTPTPTHTPTPTQTPTVIPTSIYLELISPNEKQDGYFGYSISSISDLNGDGYEDVMVGVERENRVHIISGVDSALIRTLMSPNPYGGSAFGCSVSSIRDVDGDNYDDVVVGAYYEGMDNPRLRPGYAYILSGADGSLIQKFASPNEQNGGHFGYSVSSIPDVNGDGCDDAIVGARSEGSPFIRGRAYIFSGATGAVLHTLDRNANFARVVCGIADVNGDGRGDVVVSSADGLGVTGENGALIFSGSDGTLLRKSSTSYSPSALSGIKDIDDDGWDDIIVGTRDEVYVYSGQSGTLLYTLTSTNITEYGNFGSSVSNVPDVNGDGYEDIVVGAAKEVNYHIQTDSGLAYLFSGYDGALLKVLIPPHPESEGLFGYCVAGIADLDDDGKGDVVIGAPNENPDGSPENAGRVYIYFSSQPSAISTPTPTQTYTPTPTYTSGPGAAEVTIPIPGLPADATPLMLIKMPAGNFSMGSYDGYSKPDEKPPHRVDIDYELYIGRYEITQAQWLAVMGSWPETIPSSTNGQGNDYPAYNVSWNDCQSFIAELNKLGTGTFRLPSEAEWEYACRASSDTMWFWGNDANLADYCAWYYLTNAPNGSKPVGGKLPNAWNLFDMSGNVWEWCEDDIHTDYSVPGRPDDGSAWIDYPRGPIQVVRGGFWYGDYGICRSSSRGSFLTETRVPDTGFRVVWTP
jgi:formylglycine-generating enzyme required for sulfatase activity